MPRPSTPDLAALIARARTADGQPPFSDQALVDLRTGSRRLLTVGPGAAIVGEGEAELVVDPDARGTGNGTALLEAVLADTGGDILIWSHGDHPAARALAASHGFSAVRTLLQLESTVPAVEPEPVTETFRPGIDEDEWVALNARTFAFHPEQGSVARADLEELEREEWFDADDFLVARRDGRMVGYNWLMIEPGASDGEIYVIGV
ncbi:MAG TPA: mycothiol synthase, partial [Lacisediminihabitans sp.]|uniref:mycothiol synthase n=1 Tax=Lacisediminihabitans sp. TaxID=2787631 RepID=UPI002ED9384A